MVLLFVVLDGDDVWFDAWSVSVLVDVDLCFQVMSDGTLPVFKMDVPALVECFVAHVCDVVYAVDVLCGLANLPPFWVRGLFSCIILDELFRREGEWGGLRVRPVGSFLVDVRAGGNATLQWSLNRSLWVRRVWALRALRRIALMMSSGSTTRMTLSAESGLVSVEFCVPVMVEQHTLSHLVSDKP